ncbi:MAG: hypothetical protein MHM6MM_002997 [Cercozoa sp. M6MM]
MLHDMISLVTRKSDHAQVLRTNANDAELVLTTNGFQALDLSTAIDNDDADYDVNN